ncbi:MAG: hypothetical protein KJ767_01535 [Nanoarchaeota archaeon]|nr:hypothetical protein [Nanoarchaeota archaeon]
MEEEEAIAAGIKQALKKGDDINKAIRSFLNAGYPRELVERAARKATGSNVNMPTEQERQQPIQRSQQQPSRQQPSRQAPGQPTYQQPRQMTTQQPTQRQYPMPSRQMPYQRPELRQPIHRMPDYKDYNFKPLKKEFAAEKTSKSNFLEWTIAIIVIILTLLLNGFLIWKFMLG